MKNFAPFQKFCEICGKSKANKSFTHMVCSKIKQKRRLAIDVKAPPKKGMQSAENLIRWAHMQYQRIQEGT